MNNLDDKHLSAAVEALGPHLVEFLCACPLGQINASNAQAWGIILQIDSVLTVNLGEAADPDTMTRVLIANLANEVDGKSVGLISHLQSGGVVGMPEATEQLDRLVITISANCYPLILLPTEEYLRDIPGRLNTQVASALFQLESAKEFRRLVLEDAALAAVFKHHSEMSGHTTSMIYRSTGHGSELQLWMLLDLVFAGAVRSSSIAGALPPIGEFVESALRRWQLIRRVLTSNVSQSVPARLAFSGVRLPSPGPYEFGSLKIREVNDLDTDVVPKHLKGGLTGTNSVGESVLIDYSGDVVVETTIPYIVRFVDQADGEPSSFPAYPQDILDKNNLAEASQRLRASLLFSVEREHRVQIVPSWQFVDDPLEHGTSSGWNDPRQAVGLMPTQLTEADIKSWRHWYDLLGVEGSSKVDIALSRVLRASAERRDPVDVLIDAVIAWENLFGSSNGELKLRITASMARLLEAEPAKRMELRAKLGSIYNLRSRAVHGSGKPKQSEMKLCYEALDYAIKVIKVVFEFRSDLIAEKDGTERGMKLLME